MKRLLCRCLHKSLVYPGVKSKGLNTHEYPRSVQVSIYRLQVNEAEQGSCYFSCLGVLLGRALKVLYAHTNWLVKYCRIILTLSCLDALVTAFKNKFPPVLPFLFCEQFSYVRFRSSGTPLSLRMVVQFQPLCAVSVFKMP